MVEIDKLSIEDIAQEIKNRVEDKKASSCTKPEPKILSSSNIYQYSDFTKYHNEEFIKKIYTLILNKEADNINIGYYLQMLRSGERSKSEIITLIKDSKEGRKQNVELLGFKKRLLIFKLFNIPIIGSFAKIIFTILTLPKLIKQINQLEAQSYMEFSSIKSSIDKVLLTINKKVDKKADKTEVDKKADKIEVDKKANKTEIDKKVDKKADKTDFQLYLQAVNYAKEYMKLSQQNMQTLIREVEKRLPKEDYLTKDELLSITKEQKHKLDNFYIEFEDQFRGDRKSIKERVEIYLPYIKNLPFEKNSIKVLDVGCGRGEWLELLTQNGYKSEGIDINRIMVTKSKELGLSVKEIDVIEYLTSLPDKSLSVITGFHIIEHLPFELLIEMYDEALRVLKPNGMVIFETPNPENVFVGTSNFYTDPTHLNPIPPVTSKFMLEQRGYSRVEIKRISYKDIKYYDDPNINHLFASSTDYAVIGYKI